ncbi:MAG: hypothetical protein ACE5GK_02180 [Nitrospiria bacterium]
MQLKKEMAISLLSILIFSSVASHALEGARVELTMVAEKETVVINDQGEKEVQYVTPKIVIPGDVIVYTVNYINQSDDISENTFITNKIPDHLTYIENSASGTGTDILFSVDGGRQFAKPRQLIVRNADGRERSATVKDYTHIRWVFNNALAPGGKGAVVYRARIN